MTVIQSVLVEVTVAVGCQAAQVVEGSLLLEADHSDQVGLGSVLVDDHAAQVESPSTVVDVVDSHSDQVDGSALLLVEDHSLHALGSVQVVLFDLDELVVELHADHVDGSALELDVLSQEPQAVESDVAAGVGSTDHEVAGVGVGTESVEDPDQLSQSAETEPRRTAAAAAEVAFISAVVKW